MRILVPFELVTAGAAGYLEFLVSRRPAHFSILSLHLATIFVGSVLMCAAAWRRERWVPKAALILAAWVGIPNLVMVGAFSRIINGSVEPAVGMSFSLLALASVCQLVAFVFAIRRLHVRDAAV